MNLDQYNDMRPREKLYFQWQIWREFLVPVSEKFHPRLWQRIQGQTRLMVNLHRLPEDDRDIFEAGESPIKDFWLDTNFKRVIPNLPPLTFMHSEIQGAEYVFTVRDVKAEDFDVLEADVPEGTLLKNGDPNDNIWYINTYTELEPPYKTELTLPIRDVLALPVGV